MPLVSSPIANLIGGISQQPASLRLPTMCDDMSNAWPSVVSGLQKRPPSQHIANLGTVFGSGTSGHIIDRDDNYRYLIVVEDGDLKVVDLNTGSLQTVTFPVGKSYLGTSGKLPVDTFRFVTLGDFTFIVNRNIVTLANPVSEGGGGPVPGQVRFDPTNQATFYVTEAAYNTYYSCYVNGTLIAQILTPPGTSGSGPCPDTGNIANQLSAQINAAGFTTLVDGSCVTITNFQPSWTIQTQGGSGDKALRGFISDVQSFDDLMPVMFDGRIFRVAADMTTQNDDYFVVYGSGVWTETVSWGGGEALDASTMPHALIRNADGTWTFTTHNWEGRQVGDAHSSKTPSFVGFPINDIFTFTNRLGFLADENVILSEAGNYENFYRTTCAQLLDSDPIDFAALHNNVDILYHAIPYNRDFLLMSEKDQFRLTYQTYVGQKTTRVEYTTSFNVSKRVPPRNVGNSVYFVDDRPDYQFAKVYEFHPVDNASTDDADEVTAPIPELIPNDVDFMSASNRCSTLVMHCRSLPTTLFVYRFYWQNQQKTQNAWGTWTFDDATHIHWADFSGSFLYVMIERNGSTFVEKIRTAEFVWKTDDNFEVMLDRRTVIDPSQIVYDPISKSTTITMPYSSSVTPEVVMTEAGSDTITGLRPAVTRVDSTHIKVVDDMTGFTVTAGIPYTLFYQFTTIYMRQRVPYVGTWEIVQDGRLQLRYVTLEYHDTTSFDVTVTLPGRDPFVKTFSGMVLGSDSELGRIPVATGKLRIPVMAENYKVKIALTNDTPFPSAFGNAEWQAIYSPKSAQRVL